MSNNVGDIDGICHVGCVLDDYKTQVETFFGIQLSDRGEKVQVVWFRSDGRMTLEALRRVKQSAKDGAREIGRVKESAR